MFRIASAGSSCFAAACGSSRAAPSSFVAAAIRSVAKRAMATEATAVEDDVLFHRTGAADVIVLNRPKALNALNLNMVRLMTQQVEAWQKEGVEGAVVTRGVGGKAFCAGGDVVTLAKGTQSGDPVTKDFFREEYQLDFLLATMGRPHVAFMDGITMGGGVGISVHGGYRVATEKTLFAMPETAIGFFPDVGGAHFLPRLDGELGMYLALSGHRLKGSDVLMAGIATHLVPSDKMDELEAALGTLKTNDDDAVQEVLCSFHAPVEPTSLFENRAAIDRCFSHNSVEEIMAALEAEGTEFTAKALKTLKRMCPTSMEVTFEQLRRGAALDLAECLKMEYRISQEFMAQPDFHEGVRALLMDKDNSPQWAARNTDTSAYFADLGDLELELPPVVKLPTEVSGPISQAAILAAAGDAAGSLTVEAVKEVVASYEKEHGKHPANAAKVEYMMPLLVPAAKL